MVKLVLSCLGCSSDFDGTLVNCPRCCPTLSPESSRPKEAHVLAALDSAIKACGVPCPVNDEPPVVSVMENVGAPDANGRQRIRLVEVDNTVKHREAHGKRRSLEEGFLRGAKGAPKLHRGASHDPKEAHVILGDNEAIGHRVKAAVELAKANVAKKRAELVKAIAAELMADPASAVRLAMKHPADVITDALKELGAELAPGELGESTSGFSPEVKA